MNQVPNPYAKQFVTTAGAPISGNKDFNLMGSRQPAIASNGELNAGSKKELMAQISGLMESYQNGNIQAKQVATAAQIKAERGAKLAEAWADKTGESWQAIGEVIGDEIQVSRSRQGFARTLMQVNPLGKGETGRIRIRKKDVAAHWAVGPSQVKSSIIRQSYLEPPEFYLLSRITIEEKEIIRNPGDILEEKYQDGMEALMVQEDRLLVEMFNRATALGNPVLYYNVFTPTVFQELRSTSAGWSIPITQGVISFDVWNDIVADSEFSTWFSEVAKHELILEGHLGSILGVNLITDAFRVENQKVLELGQVYFTGAPDQLGVINQVAQVEAEPIHGYNEGKPERGWFIRSLEGMAVPNSRAIARGQKA